MNEILLIEDELKIARFLQLELTHEGYSLTIATEGRDGRLMAHSIPRVNLYPVSCVSTSKSAV